MENKSSDLLPNDILTIPNLLTGLRILLLPVFTILFLKEKYKISLVVFLICGASDFLDGYLARRLNSRSRLGSYLDPVADHGSVILIYIMLTFSSGLPFQIPLALFILIAVRDLLVGVSELGVLKFQGLDKTWDPIYSGKVAINTQFISACVVVIANIYPRFFRDNLNVMLVAVYIITGVFTLYSGLQYLNRGLDFWREKRRKE
jgi:cardiolipin synthase